MITTNLLLELQSLLSNSQVENNSNTEDKLGNSGKVIVYPTSEDEINRLLNYANINELKVTVAGMGTKRGFGGLTDSADILLSLKRFKGIIEHTVGDMTLTVKAGTTFKELQQYLATHNQMISLDPLWPEFATIGGIIAANDSGPKRLGYGSARDLVIGLKVIYSDGKVIRSGGKVVKNVAGYDMNKLFIGSMGTLGVITEITLKLRPLPKFESLLLLTFSDNQLEEVRTFATQLLDSMMEPVALEIMNPFLSKILTGQSCYTLAIGFEDVQSSVEYQIQYIKQNQPLNTQITLLTQEDAQEFWRIMQTLTPNGVTVQNQIETEATLKVGVKNLDVLHVIKECHLLQEAYNIIVQGHGGLGHGICQVNVKGSSDDVVSAIQSLRKSVQQLGGYVVVKHLPLVLRRVIDVWGEKPSYFFLLEGIKTKVDPKRTLNDKRFVGGL